MSKNSNTTQPIKEDEAQASISFFLARLPKKLNDEGGSSTEFKEHVKEMLEEEHDDAA